MIKKMNLLTTFILLCLPFSLLAQEQLSSKKVGGKSYLKVGDRWYAAKNDQPTDEVLPRQLLLRKPDRVRFTDGELASLGLHRIQDLHLGWSLVSPTSGGLAFDLAESLLLRGYVVEINGWATLTATPNDFYYPEDPPPGTYQGQWNLRRIGLETAWNTIKGSADVVVAVTDSGVDYDHEDLTNFWTNNLEIAGNGIDDDANGYADDLLGWDFDDDDNDPFPDNGNPHGTAVAGIVAARTNNTLGIAGIAGAWSPAQGVTVMPVRFGNTMGTIDRVFMSLAYAVASGAHVVNISATTYTDFQFGRETIEYLVDNFSALIVAAAGNANDLGVGYPAAYDGVVAVGSSNSMDLYADDAFGPELDLVAPRGVPATDIMGIDGDDDLAFLWDLVGGVFSYHYTPIFSGTSSSTPQVAGTAALMRSLNPGLSPEAMIDVLRDTAEQVGPYNYNWNPTDPGHSLEMGHGVVRADLAVAQAQSRASLEITAPDGGQDLEPGDTLNIQFIRRNFSGLVRLELHDAEGFVSTIASNLSGNSYNWSIPTGIAIARDYRIKAVGNSETYDYSDRTFYILDECGRADVNNDGSVNILDFVLIVNNMVAPVTPANQTYDLAAAPLGFPELIDMVDLFTALPCFGSRSGSGSGSYSLNDVTLANDGFDNYTVSVDVTGNVNTLETVVRLPPTYAISAETALDPIGSSDTHLLNLDTNDRLFSDAFNTTAGSSAWLDGSFATAQFSLNGSVTLESDPIFGGNFEYGIAVQAVFDDGSTQVLYKAIPYNRDLILKNVSAPTNVQQGAKVTVSYQVFNNGDIPITNAYLEQIYLSDDNVLDEADTLLAESKLHDQDLPASGSLLNTSITFKLPEGETGSFYLILVGDATDNVNESNEDNNTVVSALTINGGKDLVVGNVVLTPDTLWTTGGLTTVDYRIDNAGTGTANGQIRDHVYLSSDTVLDGGDVLLINVTPYWISIPGGGSLSKSTQVTVPAGSPGSYYILVDTDVDNAIAETDEGNNLGAAALTVQSGFDLVIEDFFKGTVFNGFRYMSYKVVNHGSQTVTDSYREKVYVSQHATFDGNAILLGTTQYHTANLPANGGQYTVNAIFSWPSYLNPYGAYYYYVMADESDDIPESDETNNLLATGLK